MLRSKRNLIYEKIVIELKKGNNNIHKISEATKINWQTVKIALDSLVSAGFLVLENKKYIIRNNIQFSPHTILGLPLSQDQIDWFKTLEKEIKKISHKQFNKIFLQKIIVQIIKKAKIKTLPFGQYLFGEYTVFQFTEDKISYKKINVKKILPIIKSTVEEFSKFDNTNELIKKTYEQNPLYQTKLTIDMLCKQSFTKENLSLLDLQFKNLIFLFEKNSENEDLFEFIEGFYSTLVRLLKLDINFLEEIRLEIYKTFSIIWELIVTYNFYKDIKSYYSIPVKPYYDLRKNVLKEIITFYIFHLQDYLQDLSLSNKIDDELRKFKGIQVN